MYYVFMNEKDKVVNYWCLLEPTKDFPSLPWWIELVLREKQKFSELLQGSPWPLAHSATWKLKDASLFIHFQLYTNESNQ